MNHCKSSVLFTEASEVTSIIVDDDENIYFANDSKMYQTIFKSNEDSTTEFEECRTFKFGLERNTVYRDNKLYFTTQARHFETHCIQVLSVFAGSPDTRGHADGDCKKALFNVPRNLFLDEKGDLYVCDWDHIRRIDMKTQIVHTVSSTAVHPKSIAVKNDGSIYFSDIGWSTIKLMKDGVICTVVNSSQNCSVDGTLSGGTLGTVKHFWMLRDGSLVIQDNSTFHGVRRVNFKDNRLSSIQLNCSTKQVWTTHKDSIYGVVGDDVVKLEPAWKYERLLWIGHLKEDSSYCHWTKIPKDLIRVIANYFKWRDENIDGGVVYETITTEFPFSKYGIERLQQ